VQTACAEDESCDPVGIPHALTTQSKARDSIAEDAEGEHSQGKSVKAHPTAEAAEVRQGILVDIRINYIPTK
jgi:hypothetical protein